MPVLKNARHEKFAQARAKGKTADEAYSLAGYKPDRGHASRLAANGNITARVAEIQGRAAERAAVTIESLTDELEAARAGAVGEKQYSAAISAIMGKAKLNGLVIDKKQLSGANGGPVQIADITRLKGMTAEELKILERALVQIGLAEGDTSGTGESED